MPYQTEADAAEALSNVAGDYVRHGQAATEVANEYYAANTVLRQMMSRIGLL